MKKQLFALLILTIAIGFTGTNKQTVLAETQEKGYITVSTTANTELPPDIVEINIAIQTFDEKSLQKATTENKITSDKVYNALTEMINKENGDYVKTSNFNASPIYSYKNDKKTLVKYEVTNNVIIHTKSIKDAGKMIDKAISLGATNVDDLTFSVSSYDKQCNELLLLASQKAYKRAEIIASGSNNNILGIKNLNGSCSTNNYAKPQYSLLAKNAVMDSAGNVETTSSPIQAGVIKLVANINASYFVK